jgi:CRP/FNR family transcriptional regulator, cyclic AMP receptor protein
MAQKKQSQLKGKRFVYTMPVLPHNSDANGEGGAAESNIAFGGSGDMRVTDHTQCVALSSALRGKLCDRLAGGRAAKIVPVGKYLYFAGEPAKGIYYVRSGLLKTSVVSKEGREIILRVHKPRDIFGELCFCDGRRREQAVAMEDSEVVEIPLDDLILHLQKNRQALFDFMSLISQYLADSYERLPLCFSHTTMERLIHTLLKLAADLGEAAPGGIEITHFIKQEELAAMISAPRQVVSSLLNQLRELRLVEYARKGSLTINKQGLGLYLRSIAGKRSTASTDLRF